MPTFEFTSPEGKKYNVNGPEEATREQAFSILQQQLGGSAAPVEEKPFSLEDESAKARAGVAHGFGNAITGGAQLLSHLTPAPVERAINSANNWLADKTGLVARLPEGGMDEFARNREAEYQKKRGPDAGTDWHEMVGEALNPANYVGGEFIRGGGAIKNIGKAAMGGATAGALNPVTDTEDFWKNKALQAGGGAVIGGALGVAGEGLSAGVSKLGEYLGSKYPEALENNAVRTVLKRINQGEKYGGPTATQMLDVVNASRKPMTMTDQSGGLQGLAGNVYRRPGEGRQITQKFLTDRDKEATARLSGDIDKYVKSGPTAYQATEGLLKARSAGARAAYEPVWKLKSVWSPRLGEFFDNPSVKEGLSKGWALERDVALAEGRPITATQMGVDLDMEGNVKLLDVPNMRLLDMAKQGMDAIISGERNDLTGRLSARGAVIDKLRRAFLDEIDSLDKKGIYKKARGEYAGHSGSLDAVRSGRTVFGRGFEENASLAADMSPSQLEFARLGMADIMKEKLLKAGFTGDESKALMKSQWMKAQIRPFFKSVEEYDAFVNAVSEEHSMFGAKNEIMGNSKTAERLAEDAEGSGGLERGSKLVYDMFTKSLVHSAKNAFQMYRELGLRNNPDLNSKIAEILFSTKVPKGSPLYNKLTGQTSIENANPLARDAKGISIIGQKAAPLAASGLTQTDQNLDALPGFQDGGSFTVGGEGGPDSQVVAFKASPGERVTVEPDPEMDRLMGGAAPKQPELRAYEPTWRDRIAKFFLGDQPSYQGQEVMKNLIGSSGLGNDRVNPLDFTPVGAALGLQENLQHENYAEAGGNVAGLVAPGVGRVLGMATELGPVAKTVISGLAGTVAGAGTASAANDGLKPEQRTALNRTAPANKDALRKQFLEENQYAQTQEDIMRGLSQNMQGAYRGLSKEGREKFLTQLAEDNKYEDQQKAVLANLPNEEKGQYQALDKKGREEFLKRRDARLADEKSAFKIAETLPKEEQALFMAQDAAGRKAYIDRRTKRLEDEAGKEREKQAQLKPFTERYREVMQYVPAAAAALSAAVPYAVKYRQSQMAHNYIENWENIATQAEEALSRGDMAAAAPHINALNNYVKENTDALSPFLKFAEGKGGEAAVSKGVPKGSFAAGAASATLPFDLEFLTPNAIDAAMLPPGSEGHDRAVENLTDWHQYAERLPTALAQGAVPASLAAKTPVARIGRGSFKATTPTARSQGSIDTFRDKGTQIKNTAATIKDPVDRAKYENLATDAERNQFFNEVRDRNQVREVAAGLSKEEQATLLSLPDAESRAKFMQERLDKRKQSRTKAAPTEKPPGKPKGSNSKRKAELNQVLSDLGIAT